MFDITDSHKDALNQETQLNYDMAQVVLCSGGFMIVWVLAYFLHNFAENCMEIKKMDYGGGTTFAPPRYATACHTYRL